MVEANLENIALLTAEEQEALLRALLANNRDKAKNLIKDVEEQEKAREKRVLTSLADKWNHAVTAFYDSLTEEERAYAPDVEYHHAASKVTFRKGVKKPAVKAPEVSAPADTSVVV